MSGKATNSFFPRWDAGKTSGRKNRKIKFFFKRTEIDTSPTYTIRKIGFPWATNRGYSAWDTKPFKLRE